MEYKASLRIVVVDPPEDVYFSLADDEGNLVSVTRSTGEDITFNFEAIVKANRRTGAPNFTGPFANGTPSKRFFYVNIGKLAGQKMPCGSEEQRSGLRISHGKPSRTLLCARIRYL